MLTSCEKPKSVAEQLAGDWHCTSSAIDAEIYATFNADKTFILYQQIGEGAFRVYNGTYEIKTNVNAGEDSVASNHILTGTYNDGKSWGAEYAFAITSNIRFRLAEPPIKVCSGLQSRTSAQYSLAHCRPSRTP